jgi:hypothetical protein
MTIETIEISIRGLCPMLMHNGALADPLDERTISLAAITGKRVKTRADHEEIARREWYGGLWLTDKLPCLPQEAIEATFVQGAKTRKKGDAAKAGFVANEPAMLVYDGPTDLAELWDDARFRLRKGVRVHRARPMRTRPRFPEWSAVISATFLTTELNRSEVVDFMKIAGATRGIGDWRPKYGRFEVLTD